MYDFEKERELSDEGFRDVVYATIVVATIISAVMLGYVLYLLSVT